MQTVTVSGYRDDLQVIALTKLIRESTRLDLMQAKRTVERVLQGLPQVLEFHSRQRATHFSIAAEECGAVIDAEV